MLRLDRRTCKIGPSINTRRELHGEEPVPAIDIPLVDVMLDANELCALVQDPHAHRIFYNITDKLTEPVFPKSIRARFTYVGKIEPALVELELSSQTTLRLEKCTLAKLELEPRPGGLTALSLTIQVEPKLDSSIARLLEKLDSEVSVLIEQQQGELDLKEAKATAKAASLAKANGAAKAAANGDSKDFESGAKRHVAAAIAEASKNSRDMQRKQGPRRS